MNPSYGAIDIREAVRRSTEASGVPFHVRDQRALDGLAAMFASVHTQKTRRGNGGLSTTHEE
jgi:small ligand-binding sensory domain FIST